MNKRFWSTLMVGGFLFSLGLGGCADKSSPSMAAPRDLTTVTERDLAADPALTGTVGTTYLFTLEAFEPEHDENDPGLNGEVDVATSGLDSAALSLPQTNLRLCVEPGPEGQVFDVVIRSQEGDEALRTDEEHRCVSFMNESAGQYQLDIVRVLDTPAMPVFVQVSPLQNSDPPTVGITASHTHCAGCNLTGISLPGYYLKGIDLARANLTRADLSKANLIEADLAEAILIDANLRGAKLYHANLHHSILDGADVTDASFANDRVMGIGPVFSAISAGFNAYNTYRTLDDPSPSDILSEVIKQGGNLEKIIIDLHKSIDKNQEILLDSLHALQVDTAAVEEDIMKYWNEMLLEDIETKVKTVLGEHIEFLDMDPDKKHYNAIFLADFTTKILTVNKKVFGDRRLLELYTNEVIFNHRLKYGVRETETTPCTLPCTWRARQNEEAIAKAKDAWKFLQNIFARYVFLQFQMDMIQREYLKRSSNPEMEISAYENLFNKDVIQEQCDVFAKRVETMVLNLIDWHDMTTSSGVIPDWAQDIFHELDLMVAATTGKNPYQIRGRTISLRKTPFEPEVAVSISTPDQPPIATVAHGYSLADSKDALYTEAVHEIPFQSPKFGPIKSKDIYLDQWIMINDEPLVRPDSYFTVTHLVAAADQWGREAKNINVLTRTDGDVYQNTLFRPITYYQPGEIQSAEPSKEGVVPYANFTLTNYFGSPYAILSAQAQKLWRSSRPKDLPVRLNQRHWSYQTYEFLWDQRDGFNSDLVYQEVHKYNKNWVDKAVGSQHLGFPRNKSIDFSVSSYVEEIQLATSLQVSNQAVIWFPINVEYEEKIAPPKIRQDWDIILSSSKIDKRRWEEENYQHNVAELWMGHFRYEKPRQKLRIDEDIIENGLKYYHAGKSFLHKTSFSEPNRVNGSQTKYLASPLHHVLQTDKDNYSAENVFTWQDSQGHTRHIPYYTVYIMAKLKTEAHERVIQALGSITLNDVWLEW